MIVLLQVLELPAKDRSANSHPVLDGVCEPVINEDGRGMLVDCGRGPRRRTRKQRGDRCDDNGGGQAVGEHLPGCRQARYRDALLAASLQEHQHRAIRAGNPAIAKR